MSEVLQLPLIAIGALGGTVSMQVNAPGEG